MHILGELEEFFHDLEKNYGHHTFKRKLIFFMIFYLYYELFTFELLESQAFLNLGHKNFLKIF